MLVLEQQLGRRHRDFRLALIFVIVGFLVMLGAFLGAVMFSIQLLRVNAELKANAESYQGSPEMDLKDLNHVSLSTLRYLRSLTLQWPESTSSSSAARRQSVYAVMAIERQENETIVRLTRGHTLVADDEKAVLYDADSNELGVIKFSAAVGGRRLGLKLLSKFKKRNDNFGKYPNNSQVGDPQDIFDAYCKYGCGKLALTFPYYYRPFFGYGFPLVGTQAAFPQGYGGNPATGMLAPQQIQAAGIEQEQIG